MFWLLATPPYHEQKRVSLLMASTLLQGASIGPLVELAVDFDSSILVSAFMGTAIAFACFSGAAMLARRREYLYLGGLLSSGVSILFWLHFASSIFGGSVAMFQIELYFGLLVFVGYMVVDTQEIIEEAHLGDLDYVKHALTLFTDFVAVFVRILIIMGDPESQGKYPKQQPPPPPAMKDDDDGLDDEDDDEHGETLCGSCGESYASDEFWICCDICERWFHGKCVKITPARAEHIKQYKCPTCSYKRARP